MVNFHVYWCSRYYLILDNVLLVQQCQNKNTKLSLHSTNIELHGLVHHNISSPYHDRFLNKKRLHVFESKTV